jgi:hypothetical protein
MMRSWWCAPWRSWSSGRSEARTPPPCAPHIPPGVSLISLPRNSPDRSLSLNPPTLMPGEPKILVVIVKPAVTQRGRHCRHPQGGLVVTVTLPGDLVEVPAPAAGTAPAHEIYAPGTLVR